MINKKKFVVAFILWNVIWISFDGWIDTQINQDSFEEQLDIMFPSKGGPTFMGELAASTMMFALMFTVPLWVSTVHYVKPKEEST